MINSKFEKIKCDSGDCKGRDASFELFHQPNKNIMMKQCVNCGQMDIVDSDVEPIQKLGIAVPEGS